MPKTLLETIAATIAHNNAVIESERIRTRRVTMEEHPYCESPNWATCANEECVEHGDRCGSCGALIIEAALPGAGEGLYHHRYGVDCRTATILTF